MVIIPSIETAFLENPRSASRAVRDWFVLNFDDARIITPWHAFGVPRRFADYYTFYVTRNPFSRLVSLYARTVKYRVGRGRRRYPEIAGKDFKTFLRLIKEYEHIRGWGFFVPLCRRLAQCVREPDHFLHIENIDEEIKTLPCWFESKDHPFGDSNDTTRDGKPSKLNWKEYYEDQETIDLAIAHSKDDFERFGYSMEIE